MITVAGTNIERINLMKRLSVIAIVGCLSVSNGRYAADVRITFTFNFQRCTNYITTNSNTRINDLNYVELLAVNWSRGPLRYEHPHPPAYHK